MEKLFNNFALQYRKLNAHCDRVPIQILKEKSKSYSIILLAKVTQSVVPDHHAAPPRSTVDRRAAARFLCQPWRLSSSALLVHWFCDNHRTSYLFLSPNVTSVSCAVTVTFPAESHTICSQFIFIPPRLIPTRLPSGELEIAMDVKALAKSKRSHTQHHSKKSHGNHHSHKLKALSPSSSASNDAAKEPLGKQQGIEKKTHRSRSHGSSSLPTNWDRYEEEEELDSPETASKTVDAVMPKSKGADFRHLVAEAQSHAEKTLESFPSLDELLPWEFGVGLGSMLAVRGEGILSWIGDDNFVVEDKTSVNQEAVY
ncbi:hypothetical protein SESBI_15982 [Sesbania bispinosa]|nr:hypothetical protein SESBI_15982 [Sesbania bispinosa]